MQLYFFFNLGVRQRSGYCHGLAALLPGNDPVPFAKGAGWAPRPFWTGVEDVVPHWGSIPGLFSLQRVTIPTELSRPTQVSGIKDICKLKLQRVMLYINCRMFLGFMYVFSFVSAYEGLSVTLHFIAGMFDQVISLLICIQKFTNSNLVWSRDYPEWFFVVFLSSFRKISRIVP